MRQRAAFPYAPAAVSARSAARFTDFAKVAICALLTLVDGGALNHGSPF
jgi:hypothetical protein